MAKKSEAGTPAADKKSAPKKTVDARVAEIKAGGVKAAVKAFALGAVALAQANDFAGVKGFGNEGAPIKKAYRPDKKDPKKQVEIAHKAAANKIQPKWSPDGSLFNLSEDSEQFKKLRSLAKAASGDIAEKKYTAAVKDFLEAMTERGAGGGGGMRSREELASLAGML